MTVSHFIGLFARALGEPDFYKLVIWAASGYLVPFWIQHELLARMSPERRGRAWNALTWACALFWTGGLSMIPFSWVTRPTAGLLRGPRNLLLGALLAASCMLIDTVFGKLLGFD